MAQSVVLVRGRAGLTDPVVGLAVNHLGRAGSTVDMIFEVLALGDLGHQVAARAAGLRESSYDSQVLRGDPHTLSSRQLKVSVALEERIEALLGSLVRLATCDC